MDQTMSSAVIKETLAERNITFLLGGSEAYSPTGHKMMRGMLGSGLLHCSVYRYNGRPKLMYFTDGKKAMSALGPMAAEQVLILARSFVEVAEQLYSAAFLNLDNVIVSMERVFVDKKTLECYFLFLPINSGSSAHARESFEAKALNLLRAFTAKYSVDGNAQIQELLAVLSGGGSLSRVKQVLSEVQTRSVHSIGLGDSGALTGHHGMHLVGLGTPVAVDIAITKPEFIFGKNVNGVDGTLSFNNAISRIHCKLMQNGGKLYLMDMGSSNGTYVNGRRLADGQAMPVQAGDRIRMANSDFELREG